MHSKNKATDRKEENHAEVTDSLILSRSVRTAYVAARRRGSFKVGRV